MKKKALNKVAKAWVRALRSGKYKQGVGALKREGHYCCLGVLCELAVKEKVISRFTGSLGTLSETVMRWVGLADNAGGFVTRSRVTKYLTSTNDAGVSFAKIADIIESQPEGLFK
ncbi:MAG: hypothetical protein JWQ87_5411 [Candidatus Sulfotelmatobacter sp.]|nr:hypothetical protein [Candidatus Sulfotelmatobacter sp.]